jgi:hypothetical protein
MVVEGHVAKRRVPVKASSGEHRPTVEDGSVEAHRTKKPRISEIRSHGESRIGEIHARQRPWQRDPRLIFCVDRSRHDLHGEDVASEPEA